MKRRRRRPPMAVKMPAEPSWNRHDAWLREFVAFAGFMLALALMLVFLAYVAP